jgi:hypothetical protein
MTRRMLKAREAPAADGLQLAQWRALAETVFCRTRDLEDIRRLWRPCSRACPFPAGQFYRGSPFDRFSRIAAAWHLKDAGWRILHEATFQDLARQCLAIIAAVESRPIRVDIDG